MNGNLENKAVFEYILDTVSYVLKSMLFHKWT